MAQVNFTGTLEVPYTKLDGETASFDLGALTEETIRNVFAHGLKQLVNDAASGEKDEAKIAEKCGKAAMRIMRNEWAPGSRGKAMDPVEKIMVEILVPKVMAKAGLTKAKAEALVKERGAENMVPDGAKLRAMAEAELKRRKGLDLGDLSI